MPTEIEHTYAVPLEIARSHLQILLENAVDLTGKSVLDFGCGTGSHSRVMAESGARQVTGVDILDTNIRLARQTHEDLSNLHFATLDEAWSSLSSLTQPVDFILLRCVVPYFPDPVTHLTRLLRYLKPGGQIYLTLLDDSIKSRMINAIKSALAHTPSRLRPVVRDFLTLLFYLSPIADRDARDRFDILRAKMNTMFFPVHHLIPVDQGLDLMNQLGLKVVRKLHHVTHPMKSDYGLLCQKDV
ncbi:MAG: class I SAM-dependent methyltransferase [Magnetococcales bacterium]|nr:class I SAM-dependent methyltransferase [Magnetococcales bacterium]